MNLRILHLLFAFCAIVVFSFCKNDAPAAQSETTDSGAAVTQSPAVQPDGAAPGVELAPAPGATTAAKTTEPPQNAEGVWHYTCPKGCAGGSGAAEACAKCGTTLVHNSVYHGKANTAVTTTPTVTAAPGAAPTAQPAKAEPAQNAAGVWHYTCAAGCPGGGGAAIACATCGKPLQHNQAYHQ